MWRVERWERVRARSLRGAAATRKMLPRLAALLTACALGPVSEFCFVASSDCGNGLFARQPLHPHADRTRGILAPPCPVLMPRPSTPLPVLMSRPSTPPRMGRPSGLIVTEYGGPRMHLSSLSRGEFALQVSSATSLNSSLNLT